MTHASLIALDWGTTSLRAYLLEGDGRISDRIEAPLGIQQVAAGDFGATFDRVVGPWLEQRGAVPVVRALRPTLVQALVQARAPLRLWASRQSDPPRRPRSGSPGRP